MEKRSRRLWTLVLGLYALITWAALDDWEALRSLPCPPAGEAPLPATAAPLSVPEAGSPLFEEVEVAVKNSTSLSPDLPALRSEPLRQRMKSDGPQILIFHTHGTEAFLPSEGEEYEESDPFRTTDSAHSVIRLGDELAAAWEAQGFRVLHDRALYDYPSYAGAYGRSEAAVAAWLERCPDIALVIDLHRDAAGTADNPYRTQASTEGEPSAQVMLVVGTGENGLPHPLWQENFKLALCLQAAAESACPGLCRPLQLVRERYNQQLSTGALILEVGASGNTLPEALRAVQAFAAAAEPVLRSLEKPV